MRNILCCCCIVLFVPFIFCSSAFSQNDSIPCPQAEKLCTQAVKATKKAERALNRATRKVEKAERALNRVSNNANNQVARIQARVTELENKVQSLITQCEQSGSDKSAACRKLRKAQRRLEKVTRTLQRIQAKIQRRINRLQTKLERLTEKLDKAALKLEEALDKEEHACDVVLPNCGGDGGPAQQCSNVPDNIKPAKKLIRIVRDCNTHKPIKVSGHEIVQRITLDGSYCNYTCKNRYQEQCVNDGTADAYYHESCVNANGKQIPSARRSICNKSGAAGKAWVLFRTVKKCQNDAPVNPNAGTEVIILDGSYCNYTCKNRKQEQCYDNGTFDNYYEESCLSTTGKSL